MRQRIVSLLLLGALVLMLLAGCHGSKGLPAFQIPESFDTQRNYEITF